VVRRQRTDRRADWFKESRKNRDRYLVNYDRLNRTIEAALKEGGPEANWWPSSPRPGPMSFGDAWHDDGSGDMHFWSVWHEGRDFDHYRDVARASVRNSASSPIRRWT
jgi:beta-mannosidase